MPPFPDLLTLFFLLLAVAIVAGMGLSLLTLALRGRRRGQDGAAPTGPRHWSGDEYADRLQRIYFQKERRARAIREQKRRTREAERRRLEAERPSAAGNGQAVPPPQEPSERRYRAVLELEGELTPDQIRLAYKRQISAYHPDKVAGLGLKLQQLAEEETKTINEAYAFFRDRYRF
ncbi:MAG: J domain-containing protein [Rubricoccaceae bacterium]|nr:J domain-containing protein [Rubricoccaceae bacterium]